MEKATIILENELGVKLDIEKSPLSLTAYDFDGNVISGGGGGDLTFAKLTIVGYDGFGDGIKIDACFLDEELGSIMPLSSAAKSLGSGEFQIVLYKNKANIYTPDNVTVSGNATYSSGDIVATGDFTITKN